ncbi:MAG: hypothetical protein ACRBBW_01865 [Cellvibrionaceae bacterium]
MPAKVLDYLVYSNHNAPYQFSDVVQGHKGVVCRIVEIIAARADRVVHPHMEPIKRLKRSIELNKYQNWITYGMRGWESLPAWRDHHFSSVNIFQFSPMLVQLASDEAVMSTLADIGQRKVLIISGFDYGPVYDFIVNRGAVVESVDTQQKALSMLRQGRAEVFLEDKYRVNYTLAKMNLAADQFKMTSLASAQPSQEAFGVALVMSKDMPEESVNTMNQVLREMQLSGQLEALVSRYREPFKLIESHEQN